MGLNSWRRRLSRLPETYLVLFLLAAALLLRLPVIGADDLWYDEAISYLAAQMSPGEILTNAVRSSHPPLYYLLLHFWLEMGLDSDGGARLLSLIWNLALIPLLYLLGKTLSGRRQIGLVAAAFVAVSPFHVAYSQELRMYTQLIFFGALTVFAYLRFCRQGGWGWRLLFISAAVAAVYTHLFAFLVLLTLALHFWLEPVDQRLFRPMVAAAGLVGISFMPWLYVLLTEADAAAGSLRPLGDDADLIAFTPFKLLLSFHDLLFHQQRHQIFLALTLFLTLSCSIFFLLQLRRARWSAERRHLLLPGLLALTIIGIPNLIYLLHPFFLPSRAMAAASPFLFLLLGWATTQRRTPLPALVYCSLLVALALSLLAWRDAGQQPAYSMAVAYIEENAAAGDAVLHTGDFSFAPALRYAGAVPHVKLAESPERFKEDVVYEKMGGQITTLEELLAGQRRLWLIYAPYNFVEWQEEQVESLARRYPDPLYRNYNYAQLLLFDLTEREE